MCFFAGEAVECGFEIRAHSMNMKGILHQKFLSCFFFFFFFLQALSTWLLFPSVCVLVSNGRYVYCSIQKPTFYILMPKKRHEKYGVSCGNCMNKLLMKKR
jgi:hypothetical protein